MANSVTDLLLGNNARYASGDALHRARHPGKLPIRPARRVAVLACMDARLDVEDLLGLQTGEAHIIRNAGGVVTEDALRSLIISHHLLDTQEFILVHHTRCGMLAFTDELLASGLEGNEGAERVLAQATHRAFTGCGKCASSPAAFGAFRGRPEPLDSAPNAGSRKRLEWEIRRGMSGHPEPRMDSHRRSRRGHGARLRVRRRHRTVGGGELSGAVGNVRLIEAGGLRRACRRHGR